MKNVECNAKEMFVPVVPKTYFKLINGVRTPFITGTNWGQTKMIVTKKIFAEFDSANQVQFYCQNKCSPY